jgi:prepilin-type N-terminal cleavage/methylation domain-containing protein
MRRGFTLTELLITCTIIALLCAIITPVLAKAKAAGQRGVAISNMRQIGAAISIYIDEQGSSLYPPTRTAAIGLVPKSIQWDPMDYWRADNDEEWTPLLGSFAYSVHGEVIPDMLLAQLHRGRNPVILVSIFHEQPRISPFKGDSPVLGKTVNLSDNFRMPDQVLAARLDTSVKRMQVPKAEFEKKTGGRLMLGWWSLFLILWTAEE